MAEGIGMAFFNRKNSNDKFVAEDKVALGFAVALMGWRYLVII
jgi:hypothetical protein